MEVSGQCHTPASLHPGKELPMPIEPDAGCAPEPVCTVLRREISLAPAGNWILPRRYTDSQGITVSVCFPTTPLLHCIYSVFETKFEPRGGWMGALLIAALWTGEGTHSNPTQEESFCESRRSYIDPVRRWKIFTPTPIMYLINLAQWRQNRKLEALSALVF
jgi:hypothetical protein